MPVFPWPLAGQVFVVPCVRPESELITDQGPKTVEPLTAATISAVSPEASARGLKVGDQVLYDTHKSRGFVLDDQKYISVSVQDLAGSMVSL